MPTSNCASVDNTFGPWAGSKCRGGFDLTLLFEEAFLSVAPLALLLVAIPFRAAFLWNRHAKVFRSGLLYTKLIAWILLAGFDLSLLILWVTSGVSHNRVTYPSAILAVLGTLALGPLSYIEHMRTVRPSYMINIFLLLTVPFDVVRSRSYALVPDLETIASIFSSRLGVKLVLAVLEALPKKRLLISEYQSCPPEASSGIYKRSLFWWLNSLFKEGYSKTLKVDDLFYLDKHLQSSYLHRVLTSSWNKARKASRSLFTATLVQLKWPILAVVPPRLCLIGFNFCQPFLINRAVSFSQEPVSEHTTNIGYGLIVAYIIVFVGIAVSTGQYQHKTFRFITMMRGGLISMLYSKATDVQLTDVDPSSSVTLMSADIERIVTGMETGHEVWSNALEIALAMYLLERQLGVACVIPIGVAIVSLLGSLGATSLVMKRQALWLEAIERRISATTAMLNSMKGVKMCGLTEVLREDLQQLRVDELDISKKFRKLLIWNMFFSYISPIVSPVLAFAVFSVLAQKSDGTSTLDTAKVFTSLSLFTLLAEPLSSLIMALASLMGGIGSFKRIEEFISVQPMAEWRKIPSLQRGSVASVADSKWDSEKGSDTSHQEIQSSGILSEISETGSSVSPAIAIENGMFGWDKDGSSGVLHDINIVIPRGKISMVVGPVGCGKSTLLKAILGEVPSMSGTLQLSSLRIALCDQTPWHVNSTVQQSIVGVSDFDQRWYSSVVHSCALDDDLRQLPLGDQTQIGSKAITLSGGQSQRIALARAIYARKDIVIIDDCLSGLDYHTENRIWLSLFGRDGLLRRCRTTVIIASSSTKRLPYCNHIIVLNEEGRISEQGSFESLNLSGGYTSSFNLALPDWHPTQEKHIYETPPRYTEKQTSERVDTDDSDAETNRRTGDVAIYRYYVESVGWVPTLIFVVSITIFVFGMSFPTIWVKLWAEYNERFPNQKLGYYLGIYAMLGGLAFIFLIISCWQLIITMVPRSGVRFHKKLLETVLLSPMSFFSTTDTGVTLNRFSQDLMLIDMELPITALNTFATFILCIAQMVLIAVAAPFAAISFPIVGSVVYVIQKFYLHTSRQLRFLELEAKSPLYTQFTETLEGVATIRAFGWQSFVEEKAKALLDRSQRPFYLLFAVQRWLTLVLDLVVAAVATILIILVVVLRGKLSAGYVGVALLNVVLFSQSIKLLISFWTQLETHIGSVARIKNFTTDALVENQDSEDQIPPPEWPSEGKIEINDITAYHRVGQSVVKDFSLSIQKGHKIAIVGRTGSGKTSLLLSLFSMVELSHGNITIDGLPLDRIPRQIVRSRLIGLPQDAYLLPGSVRLNADPTKQSNDKAIIQALTEVKLWDVIVSKGDENKFDHPLDVEVDELHFSHGQRQLFCFARALLRKKRSSVLVLDEATSNLDHSSEAVVQRLLRSKFASHTIIAVAHKLDTILDFDKVVVMDQGQLVEYGQPHSLLKQQHSHFRSLYEKASSE